MFKFSLDENSVAKVEAEMKADIMATLAQPAVMNEVGNFLVQRIKFQAQTTKPFNETKSLPLLRDRTILKRIYLLKYNQADPLAEEGLSNLTLTGDLMNSLSFDILAPGRLSVYFKGMHRRYQGKNGPIGKAVRNQDIAKYLAEKGFAVFDRSIEQNKIVKSRIASIVRRYLRRSLKVRQALRDQAPSE